MFANLKNKLIEEVKASPSKFQQFANAAQAAVSSSSSTTTPNSSENTDTGTNENFFSITEEDTPQNSPYRLQKLPRYGRASTQSLNGMGGSGAIPRTRKLSNSSMASDVSFRLPTYDAPPTYHLQSDLDETSSEFDDSASTARLDVITKDQLYDAYKKSLDRYHKYRCRYTDLAKKYKELERDSSKARSVLVETQDKALRRISELREQCTLEQQAKAHLEEALRIEMDDISCKMQAYQTKLKLLGENPDNVTTALERGQGDKLIDLEEPIIMPETAPTANGSQPALELDEELAKLKQSLAEHETQLKQLSKTNEEANSTIAALRKQEEENVLLLAQTKQAIHTELEHKEAEVRQLQEKVKQLEIELDTANGRETQSVDIKEQFKKLQSAKQEVDAKLIATEHVLSTLRVEHTEKEQQQKKIESELASKEKELQKLQEQLKQQEAELAQATSRGSQAKDMEEQLKMVQNAKKEAEAKLAATELELKALKNGQQAEQQQVASQLTKTTAELEQKESKLQQLEEQLKQQKAELQMANSRETQAEAVKEQLMQLQNAKQAAEAQLLTTEQLLNTLRLEHTEKEQLAATQEKQLQSKLEHKENELCQLQEQLTKLKAELDTANTQDELKEQLHSAQQAADAQLLAMEQQLNTLKIEHAAKEQQVDALQEQLRTLKTDSEQSLQDLRLHNTQLNEIVQRYQQNESSLDELQSQLEDARVRLREQEQHVLETEKTLEVEQEIVAALSAEKSAAEEQTLKLQRELQALSDQYASSNKNESEATAALRLQIEALNEQLTVAQAGTLAKEKELKAVANKLNKLKKQHEQLQAKHSEQGTSLEQLKAEAANAEQLRREKQELQERVNVILEEITTMQAHVQEVQAAQTQLEREKQQLETHIEALQQQQQERDAHGEQSSARLEEIERENSKLAEHNCLLQEQNNHLQKQQDELNRLQNKLQQVLDEHSKLQNAQEIMEHDHRTLQDKCDAYEKENLIAKDELKCLQQEKDTLEAQRSSLQLDLDQAQQQLSEVRERQRELEQHLAEQTHRCSELEASNEQVATLQATVHNLREQLDSFKEAEKAMLEKAQAASVNHAAQLETLEARWSAANGDVQRLHEANDALQREIETLKNSTHEKSAYEQLQIENEYLNKHTKQLEIELSQALTSHGDSGEKLKSLQCELYVLQEQVLQHASQLAEKDSDAAAAKAEAAQLKSALEEQTIELTRQVEHAKFVSEQNDSVQKELLQSQQQLQERQAELSKAQERCLSLEEQLDKQQSEQDKEQAQPAAALSNDSEHLRSLNEQLQRELEDLKHKSNGEQTNLQQEIDELQANNKEMTERITELETLRAGIQAQQLLASLAPKSVQQAAANDEKAQLESKLKDIMNEVQDVTNRNLFLEQKCENFLILEQSNERLKLQNAKLSRQLDETLVSMQHSDSVPANTEFEYLRNIMFQYLTGNTNNETLVKVISAVLKFSPQQAQVALEKEHQRRSLLNKLI
ncbi:myosin-11 [Drosophila novamexicana]|uniref:myosin-11 n=1 Tax=Drosophila novamexicana TaxID=47314 RepID=UPI0011E5CF65|nr:myosin-11 [Drosophila novamexicana]